MTQKILTKEGLEKIKKELEDLKTRRPDITDKIEKAKELGDLSENAEYQAAKEEQGMVESRIAEIEAILRSAIVTEQDEKAAGKEITIGTTFVVEDYLKSKIEFTIVGFNEADPAKGRISNESPLGQAFLGRSAGDDVEVEVPKGVMVYKILEIK